MFRKVLIANRGAIACRIIRTLDRMGVASVAVYSDADRHARHVRLAGEAVHIGPAPVAHSYLDIDRILAACRATGADAVHPGYGFLSENAGFAERLAAAGIRFIGPRPEHMRGFGLKHTARDAAQACGVPLLPGTDLLSDLDEAREAAARIGVPVMIKSTAGGGGIGLQLCRSLQDLGPLFESVRRLSLANFKDGGVYLEKYVERARHIEVQIFGDGRGEVIALGERDCSLQRRNQKVVEETPAPNLPATTRAALLEAAVRLGRHVAYESAGTIEFIYDDAEDRFYFLEVNTRLQVEHGVTEQVTGVDLVEWMVRQAAGEMPPLSELAVRPKGASIQVRLYAEDPGKGFLPCSGRLTHVSFPPDARVDGWVESGTEVTPYYDPMLAKIIVTGSDRADALAKLRATLAGTEVYGIETNLDYLARIADSPMLADGAVSTKALADFSYVPPTIDVLAPGAQSSVQDWPGRIGYWDVGVPPSGPMDPLSHRLVNRLVGNPAAAAALEMTLSGPTLRFNSDALIALGGADMAALLDGVPVPPWTAVPVAAGQVLTLGAVQGPGNRAYLAVRHGFDVPLYLGSGATFTLGKFGGHATGALRTGDVLRLRRDGAGAPADALPPGVAPDLTRAWEIAVLYGPHGAPDFFTDDDITTLFGSAYEVHFNSARTGVRLIGPKPHWARADGGEAGLHPSNIHDNAYAVGTLDFTGDMPIILGPDGPSLGGFVCPVTVAQAELWKVGQLKPGDTVRFRRIGQDQAAALRAAQDRMVETLEVAETAPAGPGKADGSVLALLGARASRPRLTAPPVVRQHAGETPAPPATDSILIRQAGDDNVLVEFGPLELDLTLRFQVHALMQRLQQDKPRGLLDLTPGIRSLQVHVDSRVLSIAKLRDLLVEAVAGLPAVDAIEVPTRIVHLPLSWDDESTRLAIRKYQELVRPDAPWCPSNIDFIRRINGLPDEQAVRDIVFGASYLVLGLGDVYLGAPVATPIDPRHRLVTTKYNPARTWTPENAVGIGGAYLCVYGMEGPGGYQFVGRTIQMWNTHRADKPWLLRFFDQIRFFPVSAEELAEARDAFPHGGYRVRTEDSVFRLADYRRFVADNADSIAAFKAGQQAAFEAERRRWRDLGLASYVSDDGGLAAVPDEPALPVGHVAVESPIPGNVWKVLAEPGEHVQAGQSVVVLESMKMEMEVRAPAAGVVTEVLCRTGKTVQAGQRLMLLEAEES